MTIFAERTFRLSFSHIRELLSIAKRDGVDICPTGSYAMHALGLSTQVPANAVFITNGSPRKINVGRKKGILFKHSDNAHNFEYKSKEMQLVVAALKEIGEGLATDAELAAIKEIVSKISEKQYMITFSTAEGLEIAMEYNIPERTFKDWLKSNFFKHISHGQYEKRSK